MQAVNFLVSLCTSAGCFEINLVTDQKTGFLAVWPKKIKYNIEIIFSTEAYCVQYKKLKSKF